tara:strand:- start:1113 stop:1760 length:648 start_codon:yes stop_codon:yes gene_type:complete
LSACGGNRSGPVQALQAKLKAEKEYSIILHDMKEEGNFFPTYYHQYRVEIGENSDYKPFQVVTDSYYKKYSPYLGMAVAAKTPDGKISNTPFPNGYQYVGNPEYGRWQTRSDGTSFWEFYGKYMMLSQVMNWAGHGLFRRDYNNYYSSWGAGRPYYGPNKQYGTNGSFTKKQNPNFFARKAARRSRSQTNFKNKINRRIGRSKSTFRSRGFSFGK